MKIIAFHRPLENLDILIKEVVFLSYMNFKILRGIEEKLII